MAALQAHLSIRADDGIGKELDVPAPQEFSSPMEEDPREEPREDPTDAPREDHREDHGEDPAEKPREDPRMMPTTQSDGAMPHSSFAPTIFPPSSFVHAATQTMTSSELPPASFHDVVRLLQVELKIGQDYSSELIAMGVDTIEDLSLISRVEHLTHSGFKLIHAIKVLRYFHEHFD